MKKSGIALLLFQFAAAYAQAYEVETHRLLSGEAANLSVLNNPKTLGRLGISNSITDTSQTYPDSLGNRASIVELIRAGSLLEDKLPGVGGKETRVFHHFFNPANGKPLTITGLGELGYPSPDWALEDKGELTSAHSGEQKFSYRDARKYFLQALTMPSKVDRDRNWGLTFQSLGHVIHHIQDMAQPQHVRNDPHCGNHCANAYPEAFFERWVDQNRAALALDPASVGYDVQSSQYKTTFGRPRSFWQSQPPLPLGLGTGLAEFTHRNFVSSGTISTIDFEFPVIDKSRSREFDIKHLMPGTSLSGTVKFFSSQIQDNFLGTTVENPVALSESIFDPDLVKVESNRSVYTLNHFNFQAAAGNLLPRAVAHSAGMINYFFRTDFDVEQVGLSNNYIIRNTTPEPIQGELTVYFDQFHYSGTRRNPVPGGTWTVSVPAGGSQQLSFSSQGIPFGPTSSVPHVLQKEFMAVFQGTHGSEQPANGNLGAVSGRRFARCFPNGDEASFEKTLTDPTTGARYDLSVFGLLRYGYANSSTWVIRAGGRTHQFAVPAYVHNVALGIPRNGQGPDTFTENLFDQGSPLGPDNDISYLLIGLPSSFDENDQFEVEMPCP